MTTPDVRSTHLTYVASLTDADLRATDTEVIERPPPPPTVTGGPWATEWLRRVIGGVA